MRSIQELEFIATEFIRIATQLDPNLDTTAIAAAKKSIAGLIEARAMQEARNRFEKLNNQELAQLFKIFEHYLKNPKPIQPIKVPELPNEKEFIHGTRLDTTAIQPSGRKGEAAPGSTTPKRSFGRQKGSRVVNGKVQLPSA